MSKKKSLPANYPDQLNPNNDAYWKARGEPARPADWESRPEANSTSSGAPATQNGDKK